MSKKIHPLIARIKEVKAGGPSFMEQLRLRLKEQRLRRAAIDRAAAALAAQQED